MKKGIAVETIILIILGVLVIGLVGYWLFRNTTTIGGKMTTAECHTQAILYCSEWEAKGLTDYPTDNTPLPDSDRKTGSTNKWYDTYTACQAIGFTWPDLTGCQELLGVKPV